VRKPCSRALGRAAGGPRNRPRNGTGGAQPGPLAATKIAFAPRGTISLAALLRQDVPEVGVKAGGPNAPSAAPPPEAGPAPVPTATPPRPSACGCRAAGAGKPGLLALLAGALGLALAGARRRKKG